MRHERIEQTPSRLFFRDIEAYLLYFLAPILTFKVSCHFALPIQTIHACFAVFNWEIVNSVILLTRMSKGIIPCLSSTAVVGHERDKMAAKGAISSGPI